MLKKKFLDETLKRAASHIIWKFFIFTLKKVIILKIKDHLKFNIIDKKNE